MGRSGDRFGDVAYQRAVAAEVDEVAKGRFGSSRSHAECRRSDDPRLGIGIDQLTSKGGGSADRIDAPTSPGLIDDLKSTLCERHSPSRTQGEVGPLGSGGAGDVELPGDKLVQLEPHDVSGPSGDDDFISLECGIEISGLDRTRL